MKRHSDKIAAFLAILELLDNEISAEQKPFDSILLEEKDGIVIKQDNINDEILDNQVVLNEDGSVDVVEGR